jgi:hypothetical protein
MVSFFREKVIKPTPRRELYHFSCFNSSTLVLETKLVQKICQAHASTVDRGLVRDTKEGSVVPIDHKKNERLSVGRLKGQELGVCIGKSRSSLTCYSLTWTTRMGMTSALPHHIYQ